MSHSSLSGAPAPRFRDTYEQLLGRLLNTNSQELNQRTGVTISSLPPTTFNLDLSTGQLPVCGVRKTWPKTAAAEVAWFLLGDRDPAFISKHAPIWDKFVEEEDGKPVVAGAYGHRWRKHFGRDQIHLAVTALRTNPSDRRVWVSAWDPAADGLGAPSKNVPCPVGFTLSLRDGRLNSALMIRSSDVFVGLPYDVMGHALLMDAVAQSLGGVELGEMSVTLAHPHLYEVHRQMALSALEGVPSDEAPLMPRWSVEQVECDPDGYVETVRSSCVGFDQPGYSCRPEVVL